MPVYVPLHSTKPPPRPATWLRAWPGHFWPQCRPSLIASYVIKVLGNSLSDTDNNLLLLRDLASGRFQTPRSDSSRSWSTSVYRGKSISLLPCYEVKLTLVSLLIEM